MYIYIYIYIYREREREREGSEVKFEKRNKEKRTNFIFAQFRKTHKKKPRKETFEFYFTLPPQKKQQKKLKVMPVRVEWALAVTIFRADDAAIISNLRDSSWVFISALSALTHNTFSRNATDVFKFFTVLIASLGLLVDFKFSSGINVCE